MRFPMTLRGISAEFNKPNSVVALPQPPKFKE